MCLLNIKFLTCASFMLLLYMDMVRKNTGERQRKENGCLVSTDVPHLICDVSMWHICYIYIYYIITTMILYMQMFTITVFILHANS